VSTCREDIENHVQINVFWPTVNAWVMFVSGRTNATKYMPFLCHIWHFEAISDCYDSAIFAKMWKKNQFLSYFINLFVLGQIYRRLEVGNANFYQNSRGKSFMNIFCNIATFYIKLLKYGDGPQNVHGEEIRIASSFFSLIFKYTIALNHKNSWELGLKFHCHANFPVFLPMENII
jgi:hypothetical protein